MPSSKINAMNRTEVLAAVRAVPADKDFVWDGASQDERPASDEELRAALARRPRQGPPAGDTALDAGYRAMAADKDREAEALRWCASPLSKGE